MYERNFLCLECMTIAEIAQIANCAQNYVRAIVRTANVILPMSGAMTMTKFILLTQLDTVPYAQHQQGILATYHVRLVMPLIVSPHKIAH